jgi:hypothetical protein
MSSHSFGHDDSGVSIRLGDSTADTAQHSSGTFGLDGRIERGCYERGKLTFTAPRSYRTRQGM